MILKNHILERYESKQEFFKLVEEKNLKVYGNKDDMNTFQIISIKDNNFEVGIVYYDCGIEKKLILNQDILFMGFEQSFFCINTLTSELLYENNLLSLFLDLIQINDLIILVCELDVYVFTSIGKYKWKIGFLDTIEEFKVIDNNILYVQCSDQEEFKFDISTGQYIR